MKLEYWIQIEIPADDGNTACTFFDLSKVDNLAATRLGGTDEITQVRMYYNGAAPAAAQDRNGRPLGIDRMCVGMNFNGDAARFLYAQWLKYLQMVGGVQAAMAPEAPSLIHRVGANALPTA